MTVVTVGDLPMYHAWHGAVDAEPLVLICGLGLDVSELPPSLLAGLARRYRVLVFDNRGAGRTGAPPAPYTVEQMAEDTAGLMRACGLARATVLGVSLGGPPALARELHAGIPGAQLRVFPGGHHLLLAGQGRAAVLDAVTGWRPGT